MIWNTKPDVSKYFRASQILWGASEQDIITKDRSEPIASMRRIIAVSMLEDGMSHSQMAYSLNRDRTMSSHYLKEHNNCMAQVPEYRENYESYVKYLES